MDFIALDLYKCHLGLDSTFRFACMHLGECEIVDIFLFISLNNVSAAKSTISIKTYPVVYRSVGQKPTRTKAN